MGRDEVLKRCCGTRHRSSSHVVGAGREWVSAPPARGVVPRWRQGSYATRSEMQNTIRERGDRGVLIHYESKSLANVNHWIN